MSARYTYNWPRGASAPVKTLEVECPCGEGGWTVTVNERRDVVQIEDHGCDCHCDVAIVHAALDEADRLEAEGPTEAQLERLYATDGGPDTDHRMAEARRIK